ncbi:hypothetical protein COV13_00205 [Candidatus Woesearchaeota archaeon CG10_big_fil_rev_8_21_14_0_10_32_9]|nr:MAG: hypothetical protein COV13_00205 [Candidatus Woesearchaeota archaeon CG10_big_fil_rev_8_21_14_0_10_32_9]
MTFVKKLVVFPTDPLLSYLKKGEIKNRYFNPGNYFDEIHIIDLSPRKLTLMEKRRAACLAGDKKLVIHFFKSTSKLDIFFIRNKILAEVKKINPSCIRAQGIFHECYLATFVSKKLNISLIISIHGNYTHHKYLVMLKEDFFRGCLQWLFIFLFLKKIVKQTNEFIYVYKQAFGTTAAFNINKKHQHLIYNKVFFKQIKTEKRNEKFTLLYVGNFFKVKNQKFLIDVVEPLDVKLIFIGKGNNRANLIEYVHKKNLDNKITFIEAVPNEDLPKYYSQADCFVSGTYIQEIAIPVLEAMSCGLPIIHRKPYSDENKDFLFNFMYLVNFDEQSFREAILKFKENPLLVKKYSQKSLTAIEKVNGEKMEEKERKVYKTLLEHK